MRSAPVRQYVISMQMAGAKSFSFAQLAAAGGAQIKAYLFCMYRARNFLWVLWRIKQQKFYQHTINERLCEGIVCGFPISPRSSAPAPISFEHCTIAFIRARLFRSIFYGNVKSQVEEEKSPRLNLNSPPGWCNKSVLVLIAVQICGTHNCKMQIPSRSKRPIWIIQQRAVKLFCYLFIAARLPLCAFTQQQNNASL